MSPVWGETVPKPLLSPMQEVNHGLQQYALPDSTEWKWESFPLLIKWSVLVWILAVPKGP